MIINHRNPQALEVRRIKKTPTIVVLFEGHKVPNHVVCGTVMLPCALYRRQVDVCYTCGELGHRADVCPNGEEKRKCRGCGMVSPPEDHQCDPKCAICGGAHPTADRRCSRRFQVPYIVRQRRRRRQSRSRTRSRSRDHSHSRSRERSHSSVRIQKGPTWADKVTGKTNGQKVTEATLPEQKEDPRIAALKQENAQLKEEMPGVGASKAQGASPESTEVAVEPMEEASGSTPAVTIAKGSIAEILDRLAEAIRKQSGAIEQQSEIIKKQSEAIATLNRRMGVVEAKVVGCKQTEGGRQG
ncbi:hypothetical protein MTO96_001013 [Rhipicephalus appendiculatus]